MLHPVLSKKNNHPRDDNIQFEDVGHKYTILTDPTSKYTSVTTWNHSHFPKFDADKVITSMMTGQNWKEGHKYWGMTKSQIKNLWTKNGQSVAQSGTDMHFQIECFMNNPNVRKPYTHARLLTNYEKTLRQSDTSPDTSTPEWQYFLEFVHDHDDFKPYRTEWLIYDEELKLAGSIDMVYENPDGTLMIYDWKRSKDITKINTFNRYAVTECLAKYPDANFWHYALQLNTYKAILEKNYGKKVTHLCLVRLHPDAEENTYELLDVPDMQMEIKQLFDLRRMELQHKT